MSPVVPSGGLPPPLLCSVACPHVVWLPIQLPGVRCSRDCLVSVFSSPWPCHLHLSLTFPTGFCEQTFGRLEAGRAIKRTLFTEKIVPHWPGGRQIRLRWRWKQ